MGRVLLISMPFARIEFPSLALSLLKSLVTREGIFCDVSHLNIAFQAFIGRSDIYKEVAEHILMGEWVFGEELFGEEWAHSDRGRIAALLLPGKLNLRAARDKLTFLRSMAKPFIRKCMDMFNWSDYGVIGFTSVFNQQVASLALAHSIKQRWPEKIVAFGGTNCDGVMGRALLQLFPFVDWAFSGEADKSFPQAVKQWFAGRPPENIQGVTYRYDSQIIEQGLSEQVEMDSLPYPDFDDYFANLKKWAPANLPSSFISLELSRGCWWGQKHQCVFCSYNGRTLHFRHKSSQRAEAEIKALTERYGIEQVMFADNILDTSFFKTLLPALANWGELEKLFLTTKANLSREQVHILKSVGVERLHSGIESLDTEILTYMCKGTTLLQNVQFLKWAREYGLDVGWNVIYGFPGENVEAYRRMAWLVPSIVHLQPPTTLQPVRVDRFSPLFKESKRWGLKALKAHPCYRSIYPFGQKDLDELAYTFDYDFDGKNSVPAYIEPLKEELEAWKQCWIQHREPALLAFEQRQDGKVAIYDTRPCRITPQEELEGETAIVYLACDGARQFGSLAKEVREKMGKHYAGDTNLRSCLDELVERRLMLREDNWYLTLANNLSVLSKERGGLALS